MYRTYNLLCAENIIARYILKKRKNIEHFFRKCHKIPDFTRTTYPKGIKIWHILCFKTTVIKKENKNNISSTILYQINVAKYFTAFDEFVALLC